MQIIITPEDIKKLSPTARAELMSVLGLVDTLTTRTEAKPVEAPVRKRRVSTSSVHQLDVMQHLSASSSAMSAKELASRFYRKVPNAVSRVAGALLSLERKGVVCVIKDENRTKGRRNGTPDRFYVNGSGAFQSAAAG